METRVLYKLIDKVIIPKYPWIKEFNWTTRFYGGIQYYGLEIYVDPENYSIAEDMERELEKDVITLFRSVGPPSGVYFGNVTIYEKECPIIQQESE